MPLPGQRLTSSPVPMKFMGPKSTGSKRLNPFPRKTLTGPFSGPLLNARWRTTIAFFCLRVAGWGVELEVDNLGWFWFCFGWPFMNWELNSPNDCNNDCVFTTPNIKEIGNAMSLAGWGWHLWWSFWIYLIWCCIEPWKQLMRNHGHFQRDLLSNCVS